MDSPAKRAQYIQHARGEARRLRRFGADIGRHVCGDAFEKRARNLEIAANGLATHEAGADIERDALAIRMIERGGIL